MSVPECRADLGVSCACEECGDPNWSPDDELEPDLEDDPRLDACDYEGDG